ncbi:MAG: H-X9-DG-CTERM domain-containing protein [Planctomycetota bacterium]
MTGYANPGRGRRMDGDVARDASGRQIWRLCINLHSGGINICFLDSSVRKIPLYVL